MSMRRCASTRLDTLAILFGRARLFFHGPVRGRHRIARKDHPQPGDHWSNFYGLILRLSADGHLGRSADIAVVKEKLKPVLAEDNLSELTGLLARNNFPYKNYADTKRLLDGLRKAGVPDLPAGFDPNSKDRLTGAQIKTLFFGHEIRGREVVSGDAYWRKTEADGTYRATIGSHSFEGVSWIDDDLLCTALRTRPFACRAVYRNPAGSFDRRTSTSTFAISIVSSFQS